MSTVYSKRNLDPKAGRRESKHAMQKKQMELLDEDAKLKRLAKSLEVKKQEIARVKLKMEKLQVELLGLDRQRSKMDAERVDLEHEVGSLTGRIRRLEHEAELRREEAYRGSRDFGV